MAAAPSTRPAAPAPFRTRVGHGAELYLPPSFAARNGKYDLIVHFHGEGRWQEENLAHAKLDVAVVSVNLGMGTEPYAKAFKTSDAFDLLLAATQAEIVKTGRATELGRLALSAWSAGFSAIGAALNDTLTTRVDAILLADGLFTNFTDRKKRTVNDQGLAKLVHFAELARKDEKLFAITHSSIPTVAYQSVQECTARLLELLSLTKTPAQDAGPLGDEADLHRRPGRLPRPRVRGQDRRRSREGAPRDGRDNLPAPQGPLGNARLSNRRPRRSVETSWGDTRARSAAERSPLRLAFGAATGPHRPRCEDGLA